MYDPEDHYQMIERIAPKHGVDPSLMKAMLIVESRGKPNAKSKKGALGLFQLMPATAKMLGVEDPLHPEQNVEGAAKYMSQLLKIFKGDERLAVAAYNAGPTRVRKLMDVPDIPETKAYMDKVWNEMIKIRDMRTPGVTLVPITPIKRRK
jgi:soluble lytic murein transglycosylase-like protein